MIKFFLNNHINLTNYVPSFKFIILLIVVFSSTIQDDVFITAYKLSEVKSYVGHDRSLDDLLGAKTQVQEGQQNDETSLNSDLLELKNYSHFLNEDEASFIDSSKDYHENNNNSFIGYVSRELFGEMPATAPPNKWRALQRYRGYAMLRTQPQTIQQVEQLRKFLEDPVPGIDFWREPTAVNQSVDIMLSPESRDAFGYTLSMINLSGRILIPDIGKAMINGRSNQVEHSMRADTEPHSFYKTYRTYLEIEKHLSYLRLEYKDLIQVATIGRSYENRQLYLVKLSVSSSLSGKNESEENKQTENIVNIGDGKPSQKDKSIIWLDAGHHAREWISHASGMFIMETLLRDYIAGDEQIIELFNHYDFYFMPVVNPDGYQYSHDYDRLWRKTRSRHGGGGWLSCAGVDPNRNYPTEWMKAGASSNPCSEIYGGPKPLSEPETNALAQTLLKYKSRIKAYISLHSYSQLMLTPWGHSRTYPPNYDKLESLARITMKAIESIHGTRYQFGTSAIVLYPAAGGSDDFAMAEGGIKYSYTLELRDMGQYGFDLPDKLIKPTTEETYFGLIALVKELINRKEY